MVLINKICFSKSVKRVFRDTAVVGVIQSSNEKGVS